MSLFILLICAGIGIKSKDRCNKKKRNTMIHRSVPKIRYLYKRNRINHKNFRRPQKNNDQFYGMNYPYNPYQSYSGYMPIFQYHPTSEQIALAQQAIMKSSGQQLPSFMQIPPQLVQNNQNNNLQQNNIIHHKKRKYARNANTPTPTPVPIYFAIGSVPDD
ncbi:hypothetical protein TRFO_37297 [Tritrichomonas foetus]|uniref:Uncharacterized protein n=1 Tax=Tritrichomonas foetus TaxID=1144522 RepID=A0A1J4JBI5_9EUKA|nr:hypothetical protein TRFO_37297 [Tritrichomonas foetus]|eukprot:OHS96554.1 hypothetical protein TRFO_37297 [Tritrichomonas foetus]